MTSNLLVPGLDGAPAPNRRHWRARTASTLATAAALRSAIRQSVPGVLFGIGYLGHLAVILFW